MKLGRTILLITCTIIFGGSSIAQEARPSTDLKQKIKTFKNSRRFYVKYDKFKDQTHVSVGPFSVPPLGLGADFFFKGQSVQEDLKEIYLVFYSYSRGWRFLDERTLYAIIDGERMELGMGDRDSDIQLGSVSETMVFVLPTETFRKIANAKLVEFKVGHMEMKLKDEHQTAFKDLLTLTKPE